MDPNPDNDASEVERLAVLQCWPATAAAYDRPLYEEPPRPNAEPEAANDPKSMLTEVENGIWVASLNLVSHGRAAIRYLRSLCTGALTGSAGCAQVPCL